jgi:DNA modification methylase
LGETLKELSLQDLTFDLEVIGFEVTEIDLKIGALDDGDDDPDDELPPAKGVAVTRLGDLWTVGPHKVFCGDALADASYQQLLGEERAHAVFADPPYNVKVQGHVGGRGKIKHREFAMASGEMSEPEYTAFLVEQLSHLRDRSAVGAIAFLCIDWRHLFEMQVAARRCSLALKNICVWAKTQPGMGSLYRSQHEMVAVFKNGDAPHRNNVQLGRFGRARSNLWRYASPASFGRATEEGSLLADHPTPKPVAMVADAILDVTQRGDLVLDPFLGGGATLIAAERTGRACRGIEIDPLYVDTCLRRIIRHSGLDPVRADGRRFLELEEGATDGE